uniref:Uncharacterized protein n=1 Tax=viral metagenome TaxID=1070528 RepID=A0A6M3JU03_9ZZZZ
MTGNVLPTKKETTKARIIKALTESSGFITVAAARAGVTYTTMKRYMIEYPTVRIAAQECKERLLDLAESQLLKNIKEGDNTAIIFYLKTQGKHRGYVERIEATGKDGGPIQTRTVNVDANIVTEALRILLELGAIEVTED